MACRVIQNTSTLLNLNLSRNHRLLRNLDLYFRISSYFYIGGFQVSLIDYCLRRIYLNLCNNNNESIVIKSQDTSIRGASQPF